MNQPSLATPTPEPALEAFEPRTFGRYVLYGPIARGGMATIHIARLLGADGFSRIVAAKRLHPQFTEDPEFVAMFRDEAQIASKIHHPNVVSVLDVVLSGEEAILVQEYVHGVPLHRLLRVASTGDAPVPVGIVVALMTGVLAGLHAAHELRDDNDKPLHIVHRDVSPHNVLLGCDGRSYITDFGIAKAEDRIQTTRTHEVKGKLAYLAPERVDKRRICTVQSDVFSMAVVLWECFAGRRLFRGDEAVDILQQVMSSPIPTLEQIGAHVPRALDDVIARALSRDLDTRYLTARALAQAIERAAGAEQIGTHADVARLMEAVFGARMAARQNQVRASIGSELSELLRESGLRARDPAEVTDAPEGQLLAELAPPMPTGRYAVGTDFRAAMARLRRRSVPWRSIAAVGVGAAIGAVATLTWLASHTKPSPIVLRGPSTAAVSAAPAGPATRRVLLPLPFVASHASLDDDSRDLDPPADVAAFDVGTADGLRHHVVAVAPDGTRAEGYAVEEQGVARADGDGYTLVAPETPAGDERRARSRRPAHAVGTVHDGFTKLR